jgi:hypothetical protein
MAQAVNGIQGLPATGHAIAEGAQQQQQQQQQEQQQEQEMLVATAPPDLDVAGKAERREPLDAREGVPLQAASEEQGKQQQWQEQAPPVVAKQEKAKSPQVSWGPQMWDGWGPMVMVIQRWGAVLSRGGKPKTR